MQARLDYQHDCESCESCIDFWIGLSKTKDADSDADSGYCSGTTKRPPVEKEQPLIIPSIIITPLTTDEQIAHNACLRQMASFRPSTPSTPLAYTSPWNSPSSSRTSLHSSSSSSRTDLAFSNTPTLRPPEESYTRKIKDTWENRIAYPQLFPPPSLYSSRMNESLPSLLPSSGGGRVLLKGETMVPLSPGILRKREEKDRFDYVKRGNVLLKQRPTPTPIQASPPSRPASYPPTTIKPAPVSTPTPSPLPAPTIGTRRPGHSTPNTVKKRWSIAGSAVGMNAQEEEKTYPSSFKTLPTGSKFVEPTSNTSSTTPPTASSKLTKPPPPRNLTHLRFLHSSSPSQKPTNSSQDSLSSLGSVLSTTSTNTLASTTSTSNPLGKSDRSNLSGFKKGWGKLMGRYSTAPSSFRML